MRVLHLVKTSVGASWALRQMRELVKLGVEVHAILPAGGARFPEYQEAGVITHAGNVDFSLRSASHRRSAARLLRQVVDEVSPDIIHSHFVGTTLTMRLALGKHHATPRVFQVPGPLHLEHTLYRKAEIATAGPRDHWIGVCKWTVDRYLREGLDGRRIHFTYYGKDLSTFEKCPPGVLRTELGWGPDVPIVGMVAFMYPPKRYLGQRRGLKGHEDLIDALSIAAKERPNIRGVFVGGAYGEAHRYEQSVRRYADRKTPNNVSFLGSRNDVPSLYPDFNVAVHPSHSENVGGAAESLMMAIPTIATNVGGFPDVVIPDQTGWLVPPKNPSALASAILEALSDPARAKRMAEQGATLLHEVGDARMNAKRLCGIYDKILSASNTLDRAPLKASYQ